MAADFVDALLGYEYYLQTRGEATRADINGYLQSRHRAPIALRTYQHYRKLINHGFLSYVPINKFDVFQSLGRLQMAADRRRYSRRPVETVAGLSRNGERWNQCTIIDQSLVGFGIITDRKFPIRPGDKIWIKFPGFEPIPCFVAWREHKSDGTRLGVRAMEFIDNYRESPDDSADERREGLFIIRRTVDDDIDWDYFVHVFEKSNELIASTVDFLHAIADASGIHATIPRSLLASVVFASPGSAEIKVDFGIAEIIRALLEELQSLGLRRNRFKAEIERIELENEGLKHENKRKELENEGLKEDNKRKALDNQDRTIEVARNALSLGKQAKAAGIDDGTIMQLLGGPLKAALGLEQLPNNLFADNSLERGILQERMIPAAVELMNPDDPNYEIEVGTPDTISMDGHEAETGNEQHKS